MDEPTLLVQRISQNIILCGGATEYFSQEMPVWHPTKSDEDDLRPIDILYGQYDPNARSIVIFRDQIAQHANSFGAEPHELEEIVRIHELAHAVIHLGSRVDDVHDHLSRFGQFKITDWPTFVHTRTSWFSTFSTELHEFLAQALTYTALCKLSSPQRSERLRKVFDSLESKQSRHYRLTPQVKSCATDTDWPLVLDMARVLSEVLGGHDIAPAAALEALICDVTDHSLARTCR